MSNVLLEKELFTRNYLVHSKLCIVYLILDRFTVNKLTKFQVYLKLEKELFTRNYLVHSKLCIVYLILDRFTVNKLTKFQVYLILFWLIITIFF
jgi:hypothetical protein